MNNVELIINGETVDYIDSQSFTITLQRELTDISDPASRKGDYSYSVRLPKTSHNQRVIGHLFEVQSTNQFAIFPLYDAFLFVAGKQIFAGKFFLNEVANDYYSGSLRGINVTWAEQLKTRSLRDIQSFKGLAFTGGQSILDNIAQLKATDFNNFNANLDNDFCFPLVSYGNYFVPNSWLPKAYISIQLYEGAVSLDQAYEIEGVNEIEWNKNTNAHLTFEDIPPCIYLVNIVQAIFADAGYAIGGSFFNDNEVKKLILPYASDRSPQYNWGLLGSLQTNAPGLTQELLRKYDYDPPYGGSYPNNFIYESIYLPVPLPTVFVNAGILSQLKFTTTSVDYAILFDQAENTYRIPADGFYKITINATILDNIQFFALQIPVPPPPRVSIGISILNEGETFDSVANLGNMDNRYLITGINEPGSNYRYLFDITDLTGPQNLSVILNLTQNQKVVIWYGMQQWLNADAIAAGIPAGQFRQQLTLTDAALFITPQFDTLLQPAANLPDMKQLEFIKSVITLFNLYFTVDDLMQVITFEKRDNFFINNDFAVDITSRADMVGAKMRPLPGFKRFYFKYEADTNDFLMQPNQDLYNYTYLNNAQQAQLEFVTNDVKFSPTLYRDYYVVETAQNPRTTALANALDTQAVQSPSWLTRAILSIPTITDSDHYKLPQNDLTPYSYTFNPRILKLKGVTDYLDLIGKNIAWLRYWDLTQVPANRDLYRGIYDFVKTVFQDLTPSTNAQVWSLDWNFEGGLFNKNYRNLLQLYINSYYYEVMASLRANDFEALQLNMPVVIDGNLFTINKIENYQPTANTLTKLILIKKI